MDRAKIVSVFDGMAYKLGSLFDGSGGFPLAGSLCGIVPVWAAEVEPYPIAVTRSRFPGMRHLGDISKVNGAEIEPVDIITFGSPCQDLSVAGKRAGMKHEANGDEETTRSGLFMEAVRIIKEMREATNGIYPRFALWENVPGAFSSNKGADFRLVLQELIQIVEPGAVMPEIPKGGWAYADHYCGDGWSLAYRLFDAQYIRTAQRRKRIHLVLDLRGQCAGEILSQRPGLRGYPAQGGTPWQGSAAHAQRGPGADDRKGIGLDIYNLAVTGDVAASLTTATGQGASNTGPSVLCTRESIIDGHILDDQGGQQIAVRTDGKSPTLRAEMHGNIPAVMEPKTYDARGNGDGKTVNTLTGDHNNRITDYTSVVVGPKAYAIGNGQLNQISMSEVCNTLDCMHDKQAVLVEDAPAYSMKSIARNGKVLTEQANPIRASDYKDPDIVAYAAPVRYIVRRLTPTECARLQGFPDRWGDIDHKASLTPEEFRFWHEIRNTHAAINGKKVQEYTEAQMLAWYNKLHTDSAEYKMWGNGIALPPALYCMQGIVDAMDKEIGNEG